MKFSPVSCPIFLGHPKARGRCSQGERVLYGRDLCRSGGTGKAEHAKLTGAGIGPKQCPGKYAAEKEHLAKSVRVRMEKEIRARAKARTTRNARPLWGRLASHVALECSTR